MRVTPGVEAHTHEFVRTGQEDTKFGFSVASGEAAGRSPRSRAPPASSLVGVHAHIGSQVFDVGHFEQAAEVLGAVLRAARPAELFVGGGLGVPYVNGESAPSTGRVGARSGAACVAAGVDPADAGHRGAGPVDRGDGGDHALPGRDGQGAAGHPDVRRVDGGMSDNPRPGPLRQRVRRSYPARPTPGPKTARVVGKHCETGDVVVAEARLPADLAVGDVLATPVTGAYGYSMASNYNKVPRPAVVFVANGQAREVVRRETFDDLLRLDA